MLSTETFSGTAFSYIRFSSREQEQGDSIRRQRELRDDWLKRHPAVTLDTTLGGEDCGVSAFRGSNRDDKHHLGRFLEAVRRGRVAAGSILLLESLDRLSRQQEEEALTLLLGLVNAGIIIVQLQPEMTIRKGDGMMGIMRALVYLSRAHEESATKSKRVVKAWRQKQKELAENKKIITAKCPAWLRVVNGKFEFKPGARETLRRIYRRCVEGHGARMIASDLHKDGVPHFEGGTWMSTYIVAILANRAVTGICQPMHRINGKRVPNGPAVENYFPAAIPMHEFHSAQKAKASRKKKGGRRGSNGWVALFGPVFDARTGERMHAVIRHDRGRKYHVLQPACVTRWQGKCVAFPMDSFEEAVLEKLDELDLNEIVPPVEDGGKVAQLSEKVAELEARIARVQSDMIEGEPVGMPVLRALDERRQKAAAELAAAQQEVASPAHEQWGTLKGLARSVRTDPEARLRVRAAAARVIERIDVLVVVEESHSHIRLAAVQVRFRDSAAVRNYLLRHRNARRGIKGTKVAASWSARSFAEAGLPDRHDLRKTKDAAAVEKVLASLDIAALLDVDEQKAKSPNLRL